MKLWRSVKVAIPSNRVNVSYQIILTGKVVPRPFVAIPSNRVNVSYLNIWDLNINECESEYVAIPSNRVNVSYLITPEAAITFIRYQVLSQSPQIGSMFLTRRRKSSKRIKNFISRNPLKSGQCFLRGKE